MHADDREEFGKILAEIYGGLDKPLSEATREGVLKGLLGKMSLLEFARVRDLVLSELENGERPNRFGLPEIWAAKRRLRARVSTTFEQPREAWKGDGWDIQANLHLLAYIRRVMAENPKRYGRPASYLAMRNTTREQSPNADASPEFIRAVKILVTAKNLWARDMREAEAEGVTPADGGKAWFEEGMQRAETAIKEPVAA